MKKTYQAGDYQVWWDAEWQLIDARTGRKVTAYKRYPFDTEAEAIAKADELAAKAATPTPAPAKTETPKTDVSYRVKHSSIYGTGRVYRDQPGATYYDDGKTQIWDNA